MFGLHARQVQGRFDPGGPMGQERALFEAGAHIALIQSEPAGTGRRGRIGIDGDDFQVDAVRHAQHAVVGAHARMRAAALGRDAQQARDIFGTAGKVRRGDDEMIDGEFHGGLW
ncbi:hypothetical protein D3C72_1810850 [compost metagenome]